MSNKKLVAASVAAWAVSIIGAAAVAIVDSWALALVLAGLASQLLLVAALATRGITRTRKLRSYLRRESQRTRDQVKHYFRNSTVTHGFIADATAERILPHLPDKPRGPQAFPDDDSLLSWQPGAGVPPHGADLTAAELATADLTRTDDTQRDLFASLQAAFADDPEVMVAPAGPTLAEQGDQPGSAVQPGGGESR